MEPVSAESLRQLIDVEHAIAILDATPIAPLQAIETDLDTLPGAATLAEPIFADRDLPPFDKSLVDGFALRVADVGQPLTIAGEVAAGVAADRPLQPGQAIAVMTGAPVPPGTEAVVPVEQTSRDADRLTIAVTDTATSPVRPGQFIQPRGGDVRANAIVLPAGTPIGPAQRAVLATVGRTRVRIHRPPTARVLVTGDEIVDAAATPVGPQIRDANGPVLVSLLDRLGCADVALDRVRDDRAALADAIDRHARAADVLLISGGVSMGTRDFVPAVLAELGFALQITKVRMRPGKPFVFATRRRDEKLDLVFGLPGNPVSGYVCTLRFASRIIRRLHGLPPAIATHPALLAEPLPPNGPREFYQPATLDALGQLTPLAWAGSADVFALARANVLLVRPGDDPARRAGEIVQCVAVP